LEVVDLGHDRHCGKGVYAPETPKPTHRFTIGFQLTKSFDPLIHVPDAVLDLGNRKTVLVYHLTICLQFPNLTR
jgi:hypothetical protein